MENKYKQGDVVKLKDGRFVYLHLKDKGADIYTALFYAPAFGINCADWATFRPDRIAEYQGAVKVADDQVPAEFMEKLKEYRDQSRIDELRRDYADQNERELERYENLSIKDKIEMLDEEANGMSWYYSTNKERDFTCNQLLQKEAMNFYIKHLKQKEEA